MASSGPTAAPSATGALTEPPDFRHSRDREVPTGFAALKEKLSHATQVGASKIGAGLRTTHKFTSRKLQQVGPTMQAAASAYDRWERRHSVAARGDRLSLLQVVPTFSGWHGMRLTDDEQPATPTGPAVSAFESYDYQIYTSQLRFEAENEESARVDYDKLAEILLRGVVPFVLGALVGVLGWLANGLAVALVKIRALVLSLVNAGADGILGIGGVAIAYPVFSLYCMLLAVCACALTVNFAPAAAGSGIPMVKAELNGVRVPGALTAMTLAVKTLGVTLVVASGLPCGREGPMVQLGAGISCIVLKAHNRILSLDCFRSVRTQGRVLDEDLDQRDFVAMGAAAGVAAALRANRRRALWNRGGIDALVVAPDLDGLLGHDGGLTRHEMAHIRVGWQRHHGRRRALRRMGRLVGHPLYRGRAPDLSAHRRVRRPHGRLLQLLQLGPQPLPPPVLGRRRRQPRTRRESSRRQTRQDF